MSSCTRKLAAALLLLSACGKAPEKPKGPEAVLKTSMGEIRLRLRPDWAPVTVAHFTALAKGEKEWTDPRTKKKTRAPVYKRLLFHRVVPGFMIQTGDPLGTGDGAIGVTVPDEIAAGLKYDRPGLVGMANQGPNTNGSQFFITLGASPMLDGRHTMFGEVVSGLDVAQKIAAVPRDAGHEADKPLKPVYLESIEVK